jgi:hypothetical protein
MIRGAGQCTSKGLAVAMAAAASAIGLQFGATSSVAGSCCMSASAVCQLSALLFTTTTDFSLNKHQNWWARGPAGHMSSTLKARTCGVGAASDGVQHSSLAARRFLSQL